MANFYFKIPFITILTILLVATNIFVLPAESDLTNIETGYGYPNMNSDKTRALPDNYITPCISCTFIQNSQNVEKNKLTSLRDIYYYVSILNSTGELGNLPSSELTRISNTLFSFQNSDGGFGDWYRDRSKVGSTRIALETLRILDIVPKNVSAAVEFIVKNQVSGLLYGNYGFRSTLTETDADISTTFDAIFALYLLNAPVPNRQGVVDYMKDHQNFDGGFGYQTNRESGIFWTSTLIHTYRGVLGLDLLNENSTFQNELISYIKSLQTTEGGFANQPDDEASVSITYDAVITLMALNENIPRMDSIANFVKNNQMANYGFIENSFDNKEGIHTTFYAVNLFNLLNVNYDKKKIVEFANEFLNNRLDGGFGSYPGLASTLRHTFDAVSLLNLIGQRPDDVEAVERYIDANQNPDSGFGENNRSNVESTYRAVLSLQLLGVTLNSTERIIEFVQSCQNNDGGFGFAEGFVSRGSYTYRAVRTLEILGAEPLNKNGAVEFLKSLQNNDGGFGNYFGEGDSDLGSTYRATRALVIMGSKPRDMPGLVNFIHNSQNTDGGFKRSYSDVSSPVNLSRSIFTYDAVLALRFLNYSINNDIQTYNFIDNLRNPDFGFSDRPYFTSEVEATFTSLWAYYYLFRNELNNPPNMQVDKNIPENSFSNKIIEFRINYTDREGQMPEYMHLVLNGRRYLAYPENPISYQGTITFTYKTHLPVGEHTYYFEAFDGIVKNYTAPGAIIVNQIGSAPVLKLKAQPVEGTEDTIFKFTATYNDVDGQEPEYVQLQLDHDEWRDMSRESGTDYGYSGNLDAGTHVASARTSDGENIVIDNLPELIIVHPYNASKPDWELFEKIRDLIMDEYGEKIDYSDVELDKRWGELVWKVELDNDTVYVDYSGDEMRNEKDDDGNELIYFIIAVVISVLIIIIISFILLKKHGKKKKLE